MNSLYCANAHINRYRAHDRQETVNVIHDLDTPIVAITRTAGCIHEFLFQTFVAMEQDGEQIVTPWEAKAAEGQATIDYEKLIRESLWYTSGRTRALLLFYFR